MWPEDVSWEEWNRESFLVEIVVMANDRKLLLADCSVIALKNSEILKTGSSSSLELQNLMEKLIEVQSVMSVK